MKHRLQRSVRATMAGLMVNAVLALVKLVAGIVGHSTALIADAVESFTDLAASVIVWRAVVVAGRPADQNHPYGHGRAETLATAAVAVMLLGAAGLIVVGAVRRIFVPGPPPEPYTLWVLLGVVVIKESLYRWVHREGVAVDNAAVRADAWHHRSDAITSAAAALGISVALVGGQGYEAADGWAALVAAGFIVWSAWRLMRPAAAELMDEDISSDVLVAARSAALEIDGVRAVEKCHGRKLGFGYALEMHIEVDGTMSVTRAHALAHAVEDRVRERVPRINEVAVHVEPYQPKRS
ncbi:MAG: cation diffusion facilitator family transporter [Verrucomicrobiae bacterium]|nr:cation diffusion facilitator family transporter [Verrucomicrobiae bacterium]